MSEQATPYEIDHNPLTNRQICPTMEANQASMTVDLVQLERMLIPLLNWARKAQGKKPIIVPKG